MSVFGVVDRVVASNSVSAINLGGVPNTKVGDSTTGSLFSEKGSRVLVAGLRCEDHMPEIKKAYKEYLCFRAISANSTDTALARQKFEQLADAYLKDN